MGLHWLLVSLLIAGIFIFIFLASLAASFTFAVIYSYSIYCIQHWKDGEDNGYH